MRSAVMQQNEDYNM